MAALFTLLLSICGVILGWLLYDFGQKNFIRETEAAINTEITNIRAATEGFSNTEVTAFIAKRSSLRVHPLYLYTNTKNQKLAGNLSTIPTKAQPIAEGLLGFDYNDKKIAAKIYTFRDGNRLMVGRNIENIIASYDRLKWLSSLMFIFMLTVIAVSFLISYFVVSRINRIGKIADTIIDTGDLSKRVPIDSNWDDLSSLGEAVNLLLERVEELMQGIRDVADNIAHDLRTPLTRLRGHLEAVKDQPPQPKEMDALLAEADGILDTFNAVLRIANIEKGKRHQEFQEISLAALLRDVVELYEPLAEDKDVTLTAELRDNLTVLGDRDMLFQLFANILDNAIKFTPKKSEVRVTLDLYAGSIQVAIADQGVGIAPEHHDKVFNRFARLDKSRHKKGSGLGLSLVRAISDLHRAEISLGENQPGLKVVITF